MTGFKTRIAAGVAAVAMLIPATAMARHRAVGFSTGAHAQTMSRIYQANRQHNAVINSVQRNINASKRRY